MNGFSLLVALATVGVDVGWEAGADGQMRYTIRIEKVLLDPLREGQAIVSAVDEKDRGLVNFQIQVDPPAINQRPSAPPAQETMVEYGWRPSENGGVDYLIQISPERLETLANGVPVSGQVVAEVRDVRRLYIFAGVGELPRENAPASSAPQPPPFILGNGPTTPVTVEQEQRPLSAPRGATGFDDNSYSTQNQYARQTPVAKTGNGISGSTSSRYGDDWRTSQPPSSSSTWSDNRKTQPYEPPASRMANRDNFGTSRYDDRTTDNRYDDRYGATQPLGREPAGQTYRPTSAPEQPYAGPRYAAASPPSQPVQTPAPQPAPQPAPAWPATQTVAQTQPAVPSLLTSSGTSAQRADEKVRPWTPLILTTLALFASLGANAYLGWLAWSFFWRFRDAASDVARARQAPARQAA